MVDEVRAAGLLRGVSERIRRLDIAATRRSDDLYSLWFDVSVLSFPRSAVGYSNGRQKEAEVLRPPRACCHSR